MGDESSPMIRVVDGRKSFGQTPILNGLNLTVPTGKIYALLGPSGCGKTVLLNCIVGLKYLDDGCIKLGITKRSEIGYMPQDLGLSQDFTVRETLEFYGRVYDIKPDDLNEKIEELATVLDLPDMNLQIKQLSGGEQRRMSLSVTLLHNPKLLLLDEPTVGVDPVLSMSIWEYFTKASERGITVMITTHYVEEARMAHLVGMMRGGVLLVEDSPEQLKSRLHVNTLEDAFLQLSKLQQSGVLEQYNEQPPVSRRRKSELLEGITATPCGFKKNRFIAQLIKNHTMMKRNIMMVCFMLFLPLVLSIMQREAYGYLPRIKFAVVSEELTPDVGGEGLCRRPRDYFSTDDFNCTVSAPFTCLLLQSLKESVDIVIFRDEQEAKSAVTTNEAWGMLRIPSNFTHTLTHLVLYGVSYLSKNEIDTFLNMVTIDTHLDSSNFVMNQWLKKKLVDRYEFFISNLAVSCGLPNNYATSPFQIMPPIHGHSDPRFTESILPGFLSSWSFYFTLLFTSGAVMMEKSVGLVARNMIAGITYLERVAAHTVVQIVLVAVQNAIMFIIYYSFFEETLIGSTTLAVLLLFSVEAVGVAFGFFITETFDCERTITHTAMFSLNFVFLISGMVWPIESFHETLKSVIWALPITPAVNAYRHIALKGQGLENYTVVLGFVSCAAWVAIFSFLTFVLCKVRRFRRIL